MFACQPAGWVTKPVSVIVVRFSVRLVLYSPPTCIYTFLAHEIAH